jgi:V/A-type H+-transporting ATPase subunit E
VAGSELIALLEREAQAERERVLDEARVQAEAIRAQAARDAEEYLEATRTRLEAEGRAALVKARSAARLKATSLVLQAKEEEIGRVFVAAARALAELVRDPARYPDVLQAFIEEGLKGVAGRTVVTVNPSDEGTVVELARRLGWEIEVRTDPAVSGGARIASPDGRFVVTNTVTSRLERARPALAADVAKTLWG